MTSSKNGAPGIAAEEYTRGVGVYPGDPREDFSPHLLVDPTTYRNLALRRPVFQSGSYDYNLTAQLVTDGIVETGLPRWLAVSTSQQGEVSKADRELLFELYLLVINIVNQHEGTWLFGLNRAQIIHDVLALFIPGQNRIPLRGDRVTVPDKLVECSQEDF